MYHPRFHLKKSLKPFIKKGLLHSYLKLLWNQKLQFACENQTERWTGYYQVKWAEEFKPDHCPYDVVLHISTKLLLFEKFRVLANVTYFPMCSYELTVSIEWQTFAFHMITKSQQAAEPCVPGIALQTLCPVTAQWLWGRLWTHILCLLKTPSNDQLNNTINTLLLRIIAFTHWK